MDSDGSIVGVTDGPFEIDGTCTSIEVDMDAVIVGVRDATLVGSGDGISEAVRAGDSVELEVESASTPCGLTAAAFEPWSFETNPLTDLEIRTPPQAAAITKATSAKQAS